MATTGQGELSLGKIIDFVMLGLILVVFTLAFVGLQTAAVVTGVAILPGLGLIIALVALVGSVIRSGVGLADIVLVVFMAAVAGLVAAKKTAIAIAVGCFVPPGIGLIVAAMGGIMAIVKRGHATGRDYSSFPPEVEQTFDPHEQLMRSSSRKALLIGFGTAGFAFIIGSVIVMTMYTPCSKYCERPPSVCKTDAEVKAFMDTCARSCSVLEREPKGAEQIERLTGCAFSNTTSGTCEAITKKAIGLGLWCKAKD